MELHPSFSQKASRDVCYRGTNELSWTGNQETNFPFIVDHSCRVKSLYGQIIWPWTNHSLLPQGLCAIQGDQTKWIHMAPHNSKNPRLQLMLAKVKSQYACCRCSKILKHKDRKWGAVFKSRQNYSKCHANTRQLNATLDLWESHTITEALGCSCPANPHSINIGLSTLNTKKLWLPFD